MSTGNAPQFYPNTLSPVVISKGSLEDTLKQLQEAIKHGAILLQENCPPLKYWGKSHNTGFYAGFPGIVLAFLRLDHQVKSLGVGSQDFHQLAIERILPEGPDVPILHERVSPFGSSSALAGPILRILASRDLKTIVPGDDTACIQEAMRIALTNGHMVSHGGSLMGSDEVLFGRAGLLWALLNLRLRTYEDETAHALTLVFKEIPRLVDRIIASGIDGREDFISKHGEQYSLPLMWHWKEDRYSLGAIHGIAGILSSLLACKPEELSNGAERNYWPLIAGTITGLCKICIANGGHLPTSLPFHGSSRRSSPLVQICHGSPGFLNLMACARRNRSLVSTSWQLEWDKAISVACDRVWEEGILYKGGGLCHGIAGNAWSLLLLHDSFQYDEDFMETTRRNYVARTGDVDAAPNASELTGDHFLARALALLLEAQKTPPYNDSKRDSSLYRMPDRPYSLAEGLAGTVCAWANACVILQSRLRSMHIQNDSSSHNMDAVFQEYELQKLEIPMLAYHKPTGLL
ncbi:lanthionine synthetase C family protein [Aspergillus brunneoviolaceus CBS 621.78]|uniref:Lanthionine synthetase C family protein n=1 Tax=Aspergillus brunneoviolaceus CBS 621.78 TaxID=1450534 RepID=A0ACD1G5A4_9EURO|nr:lanthionine synthetase C family protein [Aspergillus brunneoviolaceus CBS 621.78]RAH44343.1 lanthionine synthetase C family protein [Aspergillus brunneoviolaceus CBS 621.78]